MKQVSVRGVQFDQLCACGMRPPGGGGKTFNNRGNFRSAESLRNLVALGKSQRAGSKDGSPAALGGSDWLAPIPGFAGAGFPAGVSQLYTRHRSLFADK